MLSSEEQSEKEQPFLLSTTTVNDEEAWNNKKREKRSYDETVERCIGTFGWSQLLQAILASMAWIFDAQQTFITIFTDLVPTWHCSSSSLCDGEIKDVCALPEGAWAWDVPAHTSVVSEWSLECAGPVVMGLPATSYFIGCLVGGVLLSTFADTSIGRKKMLVFSCLFMNVGSVLTAASPNVWIYSLLRFLSGAARATIGTCALVLATEVVRKKWRGQVGTIGFVCFTLGFLSLPGIAYFNAASSSSSWRSLYIWTGIPGIIYSFVVHFGASESPRWLLIQGLKQYNNQEAAAEHLDLYSALKVLLNKGWALRRLGSVMLIAFGIGMVYYGIPIGVGEIMPFNLYLSTTLNALSELPASLATFLLIHKLKRRSWVLGFGVVSSLCCMGCAVFVMSLLKIGLELIAFFCVCTGFNLLLIYTIELFPTSVRNSAVSMVRQAMVLGGAISPLLVALGRTNRFFSYGVFGLVVGLLCLFVVCLPETLGTEMCDTIDEEESKQNEYK